MHRKKWLFFCVLILTLSTISSAWAASPYLFTDSVGKWWEQSIAECSAAGLVGGRGNGKFDPKASVSRGEAILFLNRALGHRAEADNYNMSAGGYNFPASFPEAYKKNVAFAADKGYISKAGIPSMQPTQPANRAEIAVLFANALKLNADGYQLNFKDNSAIPSSLQSYVAAAVKHGIMSGRTDNKFDPNANVTRAEMAAIIARLVESGKISPYPDKQFVAKLTAVDAAAKKITVNKGGQTLSYGLQTDALIYKDGTKIALNLFKANDSAKIVLDSTNKVVFMAYSTASPTSGTGSTGTVSITTTYTGTIKGLATGSLSFQPDSGAITAYPLSSTVKITQSGLTKDLTALTSGTRAEIKVTGGSVTEVNLISNVPTGTEKKGYIVNMYLDYFTIRYDDGTSEQIEKNLVTGTFYQYARGQRVALYKSGNFITSIVPLSETSKLFGDVVSVNSSTITIEDLDGYERSIEFASSYKVKDKDGDTIDLDDIEKEDSVEIELNTQNKAVTIKLSDGSSSSSSSSSNLYGEITDVDTTGTWGITIQKPNGSKKTYVVKSNVDVYDEDGDDLDFDDLKKGEYVKLKQNSSNDVTRIDVLDVEEVEGEVTDVDTSGSWGITIKKSSSSTKTYAVSKDVTVDEDGSSRDFDDIEDGNNVKLVIDNDEDEVIAISILDENDDDTYEGTITALDIDDDKITIKKSSSKTYTLASSVTVEKDGKDLDLEDILIGSEVEVTLKDGKVKKIEITDDEDIDIEGEMVSVSSSYIKLKQENGEHKLYYASNVKLYNDSGKSISISDLDDYEDEDVSIELRDGEIYRLEVQ